MLHSKNWAWLYFPMAFKEDYINPGPPESYYDDDIFAIYQVWI